MRGVRLGALALVALVAAAPLANATDYCNGNGPVLDVAGQAYVTLECPPPFCQAYLWSMWVYLESNDEPGLQRGGVSMLGDADICQDSPNPDFLVV